MSDSPPAVRARFAGDDVEAHAPGTRSVGAQPGLGAARDALLFAGVDGFFGRTVSSRTAGFDFDERPDAGARNDQIDLDAFNSNVRCDDAIPSTREMRRRHRFTSGAQGEMVVQGKTCGPGDRE